MSMRECTPAGQQATLFYMWFCKHSLRLHLQVDVRKSQKESDCSHRNVNLHIDRNLLTQTGVICWYYHTPQPSATVVWLENPQPAQFDMETFPLHTNVFLKRILFKESISLVIIGFIRENNLAPHAAFLSLLLGLSLILWLSGCALCYGFSSLNATWTPHLKMSAKHKNNWCNCLVFWILPNI